ncbi:MAG TPA: hypothetical protein PKW66_27900, partial [Polyangiaceae bacterium]|nr:hypothetical protein [Polyangiaceae bacterium]
CGQSHANDYGAGVANRPYPGGADLISFSWAFGAASLREPRKTRLLNRAKEFMARRVGADDIYSTRGMKLPRSVYLLE